MLKTMRKAYKDLDEHEVAAYTAAAEAINDAHRHKFEKERCLRSERRNCDALLLFLAEFISSYATQYSTYDDTSRAGSAQWHKMTK